MNEITALESRITAALDRIRKGIEAGPSSPDTATLQVALDEERAANTELEARVEALRARQDIQVSELTKQVEAQRTQLATLDAAVQTLKASNEEMREINVALRNAVTEGLSPELVNKAAAAEMDAVAAQRSAEIAELDAILAELKPILEEASDAAG